MSGKHKTYTVCYLINSDRKIVSDIYCSNLGRFKVAIPHKWNHYRLFATLEEALAYGASLGLKPRAPEDM